MRYLKSIGLVPLFVLGVFVTSVMAQQYGAGSMGSQQGRSIPSQPPAQILPQEPGQAEMYKGTLTSIDPVKQEILVRTEVPGLLGPQLRDVPFKVGKDTTSTVCFKSLNRCESAASGQESWQLLSSIENMKTFSSVQRNVIVVGEPESGRVVHVEVEYQI